MGSRLDNLARKAVADLRGLVLGRSRWRAEAPMDSSEKPPARSNDAVGNLWRFYEEHASQARQHENLRATVISILSSIAAAVVALVGAGGINHADIPASVVVVLLGLLGIALGIKHYERNRMHTQIMAAVRREIDSNATSSNTREIRDEAVRLHNETFLAWPWPRQKRLHGTFWTRVPLHILWLLLPLAIALLGLVVLLLCFVGVSAE